MLRGEAGRGDVPADHIVERETASRDWPALWAGSAGLMILGLQPILLGALLTEGRVTYDELALIATAEILAIGIGSAVFAFIFSTTRMRTKTAVLFVLTAIGQYLSAGAPDPMMLLGVRAATGLVEGALVAVAVEWIARAAHPQRLGGHFVLLQTLAQSIAAAMLALAVVPAYGSFGGFVLLAVIALASLSTIAFITDDYGPLAAQAETGTRPRSKVAPVLSLAVVFTFYLFIGAIWAFLEPLGVQYGVSAATVGVLVSASLLAQVVGAFLATLIEGRIGFRVILPGAAVAAIAITVLYAASPTPLVFAVATLATGLIWLFVVPWQIGMTIDADASRKTALLIPAAQLFGAAIGPIGATLLISGENMRPVAYFAMGAAVACLVLCTAYIGLFSRRPG